MVVGRVSAGPYEAENWPRDIVYSGGVVDHVAGCHVGCPDHDEHTTTPSLPYGLFLLRRALLLSLFELGYGLPQLICLAALA